LAWAPAQSAIIASVTTVEWIKRIFMLSPLIEYS
jgi:hypothetical protein